MDYTDIVAGMTGQQFIEVINGNNALTKQQLETLAANILLRVIANNVKEIKAENNKLLFTLDGENWIGTDNNVWGSILGNITDQTDLKQLLDEKASNDDLNTTNTNVTNLNNRIDSTNTNVQANTSAIAQNAISIGQLQTKQAKQVSSDTIVLLRIGSSGYMQYSLDGTTWNNVQSVANINWGAVEGEITNQTDLIELFSSKLNTSVFNAHANNKNNPHEVSKSQIGLGNVSNTSDEDKPISRAQQEALNTITGLIEGLDNSKLTKTDEVQNIEYMSLVDWNAAKEAGDLSNTTIYIVE